MSDLDRRQFVHRLLAAAGVAAAGCAPQPAPSSPAPSPVVGVEPLGRSPWKTVDPFLFCAYHLDAYPRGDQAMGPAAPLTGRELGRDFSGVDGWSMYHGRRIPGFPRHPHRGFETVTVTRRGLVDHSDSLGATARYGDGDAQWMTAGNGIVHAEMFPLRALTQPNPLELFQLWLNLPAASKRVAPHFAMMWHEGIPTHRFDAGRVEVRTIAGALDGRAPQAPPPASWASVPEAHVAVWTVVMAPGSSWELPAAVSGLSRALYFHRGRSVQVGPERVSASQRVALRSERAVPLQAGPEGAELLLLQGRPIGEPVVRQGPFAMNTRAEIQEAYADYRRTGFGGWPWADEAPAHARERGRFALYADGRRDVPV